MSYSGPNVPASAINPMIESPYIPSTESTVSGRSSSPEHPGERVADSSMPQHTSLAMQYVNHANVSTTGYAYAEHGRLHGVTDVDVDEKPHLVYETMTDLQATRQRMVMNGGPPGIASNHVDAASEKYAGIPNKPVKQRSTSATICLIKVIWNLFLFIVVVGAFSLSVYNFLNNSSSTVAPSPTETPSDSSLLTGDGEDDTSVLLAEFNRTVTELRAELERQSSLQESRYRQLNNTIFSAVASIGTVSANNELDLTAGCATDVVSTCVINHNNVGTPPTSLTCETPVQNLEEPGFRNVNIFCSIDNSAGETNPVTSTMNVFGGEVSCLCSLVALTDPVASPECRLTIQRCPNTITFNITDGRSQLT